MAEPGSQLSHASSSVWPALRLAEWKDTRDTLHMWTQIVGKMLALSPRMNHWWEVALYVSARGLTTSPIPYGAETFEMRFDFIVSMRFSSRPAPALSKRSR